MPITTVDKEKYVIIRLNCSKLNYETANTFSGNAVKFLEETKPTNIAIDFNCITYMSSIGISALSVIKGMANVYKCRIVLFNVSEEILATLKITGIDTLFEISSSENDLETMFNA